MCRELKVQSCVINKVKMSYRGFVASPVKVAVNCKLQKFLHGLFILVLYIEVYTVILAILYCRASLVPLSQ